MPDGYNVRVHSVSRMGLTQKVCGIVLALSNGSGEQYSQLYLVEKDDKGKVWCGRPMNMSGGIDLSRMSPDSRKQVPEGLELLFADTIDIGQSFSSLGDYLVSAFGKDEPELRVVQAAAPAPQLPKSIYRRDAANRAYETKGHISKRAGQIQKG